MFVAEFVWECIFPASYGVGSEIGAVDSLRFRVFIFRLVSSACHPSERCLEAKRGTRLKADAEFVGDGRSHDCLDVLDLWYPKGFLCDWLCVPRYHLEVGCLHAYLY